MFLFLVFLRTMTTCPDLGQTPVLCIVDTCFVKQGNTCHCYHVSTCHLPSPVNGLLSEKERLSMSRSNSQNHLTSSSSHTTARKRRSPDVTEARAHAQRAKLDAQAQQLLPKEEDTRPTKRARRTRSIYRPDVVL